MHASRSTGPQDIDPIIIHAMKVLERTRPAMAKTFRFRIENALNASGRKINGGKVTFGASIDFELYAQGAATFLNDHLPKLSGRIEQETLRRVSRVVQNGVKSGKSVFDLGEDVKSLFTTMSRSRAELIAQTELGIATSTGDFLGAKSTKEDLVKIWSNSRDERVRPSHQIREVRDMDARFSNGLMYPLESGAPIAEIARCRCTALYVPRDQVREWIEAA